MNQASRSLRIRQSIHGYLCESELAKTPCESNSLILSCALLDARDLSALAFFGETSPELLSFVRKNKIELRKNRSSGLCLLPLKDNECVLISFEFRRSVGLLFAAELSIAAGAAAEALHLLSRRRFCISAEVSEGCLDSTVLFARFSAMVDLVSAVQDPSIPDKLRTEALAALLGIRSEADASEPLPYLSDTRELAKELCRFIREAATSAAQPPRQSALLQNTMTEVFTKS